MNRTFSCADWKFWSRSQEAVRRGRELPPRRLLSSLLHSCSALWLQLEVSSGPGCGWLHGLFALRIIPEFSGGVVSIHFLSFLCLTNKAIPRRRHPSPDAETGEGARTIPTEGQSALDWRRGWLLSQRFNSKTPEGVPNRLLHHINFTDTNNKQYFFRVWL